MPDDLMPGALPPFPGADSPGPVPGSPTSPPESEEPPPGADTTLGPEPPVPSFQLGPVYEIDPVTVIPHPLAEMLPEPSRPGFEQLYTAIAVDGQQVPGVMLGAKLLDGRSRRAIREDLGLPLKVQDFSGSEEQALAYVLGTNLQRRDLSAAQRACVAAFALPRISEETAASRLRKYRETIARRRGEDCVTSLSPNLEERGTAERARTVAARMTNASEGYVGYALRLQREAPELFRQVWLGQTSMTAAMRELTGQSEPDFTRAVTACRRRLSTGLRNRQHAPVLLGRLNALLDEFEREYGEG